MVNTRIFGALFAAGLLWAAGVPAQDSGAAPAAAPDAAAPAPGAAPAGDAAASGASGSSDASGGGDEAPAAPVKPRPAEMEPRAAASLLLGIANTGKHLVAVGDRGNIVVSNDGDHWAQVDVPVRSTLTAVDFLDENNGWAVGHDATILHTGDGGKTWQLQNFQPELEKPLLGVLFLDASKGFAVGAYGLFLSTTDGGATWADFAAPPVREDELHLNSIVKLKNGQLMVVGESGMVGISKDGTTWEKLKAPGAYEGSFYGALPKGDKGVIVFGLRGNVYATDDVRSNKWTKLDIGSATSMFGGVMLPTGEPALVGLSGAAAILRKDGTVKQEKIEAIAGTLGTGTLSAAIPWKGQLLAVGELGVSHIRIDN